MALLPSLQCVPHGPPLCALPSLPTIGSNNTTLWLSLASSSLIRSCLRPHPPRTKHKEVINIHYLQVKKRRRQEMGLHSCFLRGLHTLRKRNNRTIQITYIYSNCIKVPRRKSQPTISMLHRQSMPSFLAPLPP